MTAMKRVQIGTRESLPDRGLKIPVDPKTDRALEIAESS